MRRIFSDKKRITAFFLAIIMCLAFVSAVCVIGIEASHDCSGEDCVICLQISACSGILKSFGLLSLIIHSIFTALIYKRTSNNYLFKNAERHTLVSLNIKISA